MPAESTTRYLVKIVPRASGDIVGICTFIERDSPQNATVVAGMLIEAIDSLEILPHRYKVHEHRKDPAKTVHSMPVPPFMCTTTSSSGSVSSKS